MRTAFALLFLSLTLTLRAAELTPADTQALMKNLQEHRAKSPSLSAEFTEERTSHLLNKPLTSEGNIAFQVPNRFRREITGRSPSITVSNGQKLWIYYPNFKSAEHYELGKRSPLDAALAAINTALNLESVENTFTIAGWVKIPSGTQTGAVFRLKGKGIPDLQGYGRGDELVRVHVDVPRKLSARQRELLQEYARNGGEEVSPVNKGFLDRVREMFG